MKEKQDIFIYIIHELNENGSLEQFEWSRLREKRGGLKKKTIKYKNKSTDII